MTHSVAFLLVPEFQLLDMAGPLSVFQVAAELGRKRRGPAYEISVLSERGGRVTCSAGLEIQTRSWRGTHTDTLADTLVVPGGWGARKPGAATPALMQHLRAAFAAKRRVASVCTGAFLLAEAGLLDGRRATTHWRQATRLQREHPGVTVDADRIFVRDGNVWSSAGIAAGIDLALAMVEADLGADIAGAVAREMVVYHRRAGGQSQFSALQDLAPQSERMRAVLAHIGENLTADLGIERLADVACVSPRQFMRAFKAETGQTPAKAVERIRAEVARAHIEGGDSSIEAVARLTGFEDTERMRRAFVRVYGQPPQALRRVARAGSLVAQQR